MDSSSIDQLALETEANLDNSKEITDDFSEDENDFKMSRSMSKMSITSTSSTPMNRFERNASQAKPFYSGTLTPNSKKRKSTSEWTETLKKTNEAQEIAQKRVKLMRERELEKEKEKKRKEREKKIELYKYKRFEDLRQLEELHTAGDNVLSQKRAKMRYETKEKIKKMKERFAKWKSDGGAKLQQITNIAIQHIAELDQLTEKQVKLEKEIGQLSLNQHLPSELARCEAHDSFSQILEYEILINEKEKALERLIESKDEVLSEADAILNDLKVKTTAELTKLAVEAKELTEKRSARLKDLNEFEKAVEIQEAKINQLNEAIEKIENGLKYEKVKLIDFDGKLKIRKQEVEEQDHLLQDELQFLSKQVQALNIEISALEQNYRKQVQIIAAGENKYVQMQTKLSQLEAQYGLELQMVTNEMEYQSSVKESNERIEQLESKLNSFRYESKELEQQLNIIMQQQRNKTEDTRSLIIELEGQIAVLNNKIQQTEEFMYDFEKNIEIKKTNLDRLANNETELTIFGIESEILSVQKHKCLEKFENIRNLFIEEQLSLKQQLNIIIESRTQLRTQKSGLNETLNELESKFLVYEIDDRIIEELSVFFNNITGNEGFTEENRKYLKSLLKGSKFDVIILTEEWLDIAKLEQLQKVLDEHLILKQYRSQLHLLDTKLKDLDDMYVKTKEKLDNIEQNLKTFNSVVTFAENELVYRIETMSTKHSKVVDLVREKIKEEEASIIKEEATLVDIKKMLREMTKEYSIVEKELKEKSEKLKSENAIYQNDISLLTQRINEIMEDTEMLNTEKNELLSVQEVKRQNFEKQKKETEAKFNSNLSEELKTWISNNRVTFNQMRQKYGDMYAKTLVQNNLIAEREKRLTDINDRSRMFKQFKEEVENQKKLVDNWREENNKQEKELLMKKTTFKELNEQILLKRKQLDELFDQLHDIQNDDDRTILERKIDEQSKLLEDYKQALEKLNAELTSQKAKLEQKLEENAIAKSYEEAPLKELNEKNQKITNKLNEEMTRNKAKHEKYINAEEMLIETIEALNLKKEKHSKIYFKLLEHANELTGENSHIHNQINEKKQSFEQIEQKKLRLMKEIAKERFRLNEAQNAINETILECKANIEEIEEVFQKQDESVRRDAEYKRQQLAEQVKRMKEQILLDVTDWSKLDDKQLDRMLAKPSNNGYSALLTDEDKTRRMSAVWQKQAEENAKRQALKRELEKQKEKEKENKALSIAYSSRSLGSQKTSRGGTKKVATFDLFDYEIANLELDKDNTVPHESIEIPEFAHVKPDLEVDLEKIREESTKRSVWRV
eukprot:TRINITY_DN2660_c0_g1_i1.p1 TRINITY_DN2660_c0_g1~~TRINITY_DN2660_c0_g1_i1.p1  ORF type:complete len:1310 (-),score=535.94 TRINITY_DN2660_c0_g1_i1:35-3964(-)